MTEVPLTTLDVDTVTVLKSHAFTLIVIVVVLFITIRWILPQIISFLNRRLDSADKANDSEKALLQEAIKRVVEGQEKMNSAIITELESLNISMKEVKEIFINSLKAGMKVLFVMFVVNMLACDSDTITIYRFKKPIPIQDSTKSIEVLDEPKECNPSCSPPKTKCNTKTGKCEGQSLQRSPTSDLNYLVEKYGLVTPGHTQWQR